MWPHILSRYLSRLSGLDNINQITFKIYMDDFLQRDSESKSIRDGRFTFILAIGYIFLLVFFIQKLIPDSTAMLEENQYDLQADLTSLYSIEKDQQDRGERRLIPTEFTPFLFEKMDINQADKELLMTVKGIGPKLAESIIQSRLDHGRFEEIEDFLNIKGVGSKRAKYFETVFDFGGRK